MSTPRFMDWTDDDWCAMDSDYDLVMDERQRREHRRRRFVWQLWDSLEKDEGPDAWKGRLREDPYLSKDLDETVGFLNQLIAKIDPSMY